MISTRSENQRTMRAVNVGTRALTSASVLRKAQARRDAKRWRGGKRTIVSDLKTRLRTGKLNGALRATMVSKRDLHDLALVDPAEDRTVQHLFLLFFVAQDTARLTRLLSAISPKLVWRITFDDGAGYHPLVCQWNCSTTEIEFVFGRYVFDSLCDGAIRRFRGMFALFERVASGGGFIGTVHLNLSDLGIVPGLCFCDNRDIFEMIPDMGFLESDGYAQYRQQFANCRSWSERLDVLFWRGSTTGTSPATHLTENKRAALCLMARDYPDDDLDFGLSQIVQFSETWCEAALSAGIVKDHVPWHRLDQYKYHVDIDGNTNSWPGLFSKLLSGGVVLKVESEHNYKQWYYNRLRPWMNYVPLRSDLSDLIDVVRYLRNNPSCAERIARQGRLLAQSLTFETELEIGAEIVVAYAAKQAYQRSQIR